MALVTYSFVVATRYGCWMVTAPRAHGRLNSAVARVLSDARNAADITTRQLAELTGLERVTMLRYLNDQRAIDMDRLYRFAVALELTPNEVIERAEALIAAEDAAAAQKD